MRYPIDDNDRPLVAVDCIIFGFDNDKLKLLLIKRAIEPEQGNWSLMGGFLKRDENLDEAAHRVLHQLTGLKSVYLEQYHAFSQIQRDPVERTISVAYLALINIAQHKNELDEQYSARWFPIEETPTLVFDHNEMVAMAIELLKYRAKTKPIGFELLPEKFTIRQLQKVYEAILDQTLDKRNFSKKMNSLDILIKLDEKDMSSSKKGSFLYQFDLEKYHQKLSQGFTFRL